MKYWQVTEMAKVIAPYSHLPAVDKPSNLDKAINTATNHLPEMQPYVIAMPDMPFASKRHIIFICADKHPSPLDFLNQFLSTAKPIS